MIHDRIDINPKIMFGKPVIKGTRITGEHILRELGVGMSEEAFLAGHPDLAPEDIRAAQAFAAAPLASEEIVFASGATL